MAGRYLLPPYLPRLLPSSRTGRLSHGGSLISSLWDRWSWEIPLVLRIHGGPHHLFSPIPLLGQGAIVLLLGPGLSNVIPLIAVALTVSAMLTFLPLPPPRFVLLLARVVGDNRRVCHRRQLCPARARTCGPTLFLRRRHRRFVRRQGLPGSQASDGCLLHVGRAGLRGKGSHHGLIIIPMLTEQIIHAETSGIGIGQVLNHAAENVTDLPAHSPQLRHLKSCLLGT
mmetsp:Transcript_12045/g.21774  ORF Transcript_12045/g.21774 Transcript_12045/m.21774 type:complete len:227 (-) Transcript_12045:704-1384(-)